MSVRPRLAVLAVLAAGGAAFGGYYLWPSGRELARCAGHADVPAAAQQALASYAGRIRHDVQRPLPGAREESWSDPLTGHTRYVIYERGRLTLAYGTVPVDGAPRSVWVDYHGRTWTSTKLPALVKTTVNAAAEEAQVTRDKVARGKAAIVGDQVVDGRKALQLHETVHPPAPKTVTAGGIGVPRTVQVPQLTFQVDTWVDPLTYVTLRTRFSVRGHSSVSDETWLPRTPANVAAARIIIPDGFDHLQTHGNVLRANFSESFGCAQS